MFDFIEPDVWLDFILSSPTHTAIALVITIFILYLIIDRILS